MNLRELINELPLELVYKIMSYILKPQPKELMEDIRNYHFYKDLGLKLYKNKFKEEENEEEYKNWFTNDIGAYLNEDQAIMNGLVDKFYNTYWRLYTLRDKDKIKVAYSFLRYTKKSADIELNFLWGIMKPNERIEMIKKNCSKEEIAVFI